MPFNNPSLAANKRYTAAEKLAEYPPPPTDTRLRVVRCEGKINNKEQKALLTLRCCLKLQSVSKGHFIEKKGYCQVKACVLKWVSLRPVTA